MDAIEKCKQGSPCEKNTSGATDPSVSTSSRQEMYNDYVSSYGVHFRANKDYQFKEKPRQITITAILFSLLIMISYMVFYQRKPANLCALNPLMNEELTANKSVHSHFPTPSNTSQFYIHQTHQSSLTTPSLGLGDSPEQQTYNGKQVNAIDTETEELLTSVRYGLCGLLISIVFYCFLNSRDSLFVRPHPGVWRVVHAFGLLQFLILVFLFVVPADDGRKIINLIFPNHATPQNVFTGTIELDCKINMNTFIRQLKTPWFTCHVIGWFLKMCMFRDWAFCLFFSIIFEACELSFQWLIPEMKECWWDSIVLDVLVSNMIGMIAGAWVLSYLGSKRFDWVKPTFGSRGSVSSSSTNSNRTVPGDYILSFIPKKFLPFTFSDYNWRFFESTSRFAHSLFLLFVALTLELNSFFLMFVLDTKATHPLNIARTINVCLLALLTIAEHYEYLEGKPLRIGHNELLLGSIYLIEILITFKYGISRFARFIPPWEFIQPWVISFILFSLWSYFHFHDLSTLKKRLSQKNDGQTISTEFGRSLFHQVGQEFLRFPVLLTFAPLLVLTKHYHY